MAAQKVALSEPSRQPLHASALVVPQELGHLSHAQDLPNADPSTKLVILIEDAHVNYEGQQHLAHILDRLAAEYGVQLILVEGGEGDVSLSYLRERGSEAARQRVAEAYLRSGLLSGEEYLTITSKHPLVLWGVDDPALYDAQVQVFLEVERVREAVVQDLARLGEEVARRRAQLPLPNDALQAVEAAQASFDSGTLEFSQYMEVLLRESQRVGLVVADYPHLSQLVTVAQLEQAIDTEQVAQEQRQVVTRLRERTGEGDLAHLKELAERLRAKAVEPLVFYEALASLMRQAGLPLDGVPHLHDYLRYLRLQADLAPRAWSAELAQFQHDLSARLVRSPLEAELMATADRLARCERLIRLAWSPEDFQAYRREPEQLRVSQWLPALREQAAPLGAAVDLAALEAHLVPAARFYELAKARDVEMVRRTLEAMDAQGRQVAALIAGGFHTDDLTTLFEQQPVHLAVITPWVGREDDEARYAKILTSKYQRAAANAPRSPR